MPVLDNRAPREPDDQGHPADGAGSATIGEREHILDARGACWCDPELEHICANGARVWMHRDPDGAEPSLEVITEAIALAAFGEDEQ